METILPFVVAAIVFGFQIYANFKKEQEKARKRNPSKRPPEVVKEASPSANPQNKRAGVPSKKEPVLTTPKVQSVYEKYTGLAAEVEEVKRAKAIHKPHQHAFKRLEPFETTDMENHRSDIDFDLRDAVIKAAILERPSY